MLRYLKMLEDCFGHRPSESSEFLKVKRLTRSVFKAPVGMRPFECFCSTFQVIYLSEYAKQ